MTLHVAKVRFIAVVYLDDVIPKLLHTLMGNNKVIVTEA